MNRLEISLDGSHACALYGENLQEGEAAFVKIEGWPNATHKQEQAAMRAAYEELCRKIGERLPFDIVREHSSALTSRGAIKMSYCRWSSDDFQCDLYCYGSAQGITTHVASNKLILPPDMPPDIAPCKDDSEAERARWATDLFNRHQAVSAIVDGCKRVPIGLPYDGQSFDDADEEAFLARLLHLREVGYKFPDYVIETVREEIAELRGAAAEEKDK